MFGSELPRPSERVRTSADQQASLRRIAMLVATGAPLAEVFAAISLEVERVLRPRLVQVWRFERDGTATVVGSRGAGPNPFPVDSRWPWDAPGREALGAEGRPTARRVSDLDGLQGAIPAAAREIGVGSAAGAPIVVDGEPWGVIAVGATEDAPLPDGVEGQLAAFAELVATAVSNAIAREQLAQLAEEQAALRRVATLVARGAPPSEVFDAVVGELGELLQVASTGLVRFEDETTATVVAGWGRLGEAVPVGARLPLGGVNVVTQVARSGRPARIDDYGQASGAIADRARVVTTRASIGGPIVVAGRLWGAMVAAALEGERLAPDAERRLAQFTELVATAISNAEARLELARLADEQAALRRVATLVAEEAPADDVLAKVAEEAAGVLGPAIDSAILRFDPEETATVVAVWGQQPADGIRVGVRIPIDGTGASARVYRERRPVRVERYDEAGGRIAEHAQRHGIRSAVGCPIAVEGRLWGSMVVASYDDDPLPPETEQRVAQFTHLVATAIANTEARAQVRRLADEQAALRRVATLVAEGAAPTEIFQAAIVEVARLLGAAQVGLMRAEGDDEITILANHGQDPRLVRAGMRLPLDGDSVTGRVLRTGRSARLTGYDERPGTIADIAARASVSTTVGAPITVEGVVWGAITASWEVDDPPPAAVEARLDEFAELLGTAIANADSRDQLTASRARVLTAGDEARRRVVRDLHDGAQQRLVQTVITLQLAERALTEGGGDPLALVGEALERARQGNEELRDLAHGILPPVLSHGGLSAGVDSLVARLDLPVSMEVTGARLAPEIEASAYFVVAEALTNVVKHAHATRAEVRARVDDGRLRLEVRDDGIGGAKPQGPGLLGLADRVAALGGRLRIDSPRGGGTALAVDLPLPPQPATRA